MREDVGLGFGKKDRNRIRRDHMEEIISGENGWDHVTAAGMVEGPIGNGAREEMAIAMGVIRRLDPLACVRK